MKIISKTNLFMPTSFHIPYFFINSHLVVFPDSPIPLWFLYMSDIICYEKFADTKGVIRIRISKQNTMAKRKSTKGQTMIYKTHT
jgi:hypothetical protein